MVIRETANKHIDRRDSPAFIRLTSDKRTIQVTDSSQQERSRPYNMSFRSKMQLAASLLKTHAKPLATLAVVTVFGLMSNKILSQKAEISQLHCEIKKCNKSRMFNILLAEARKRKARKVLKTNRKLYAFAASKIRELIISNETLREMQVDLHSTNRFKVLADAPQDQTPGVVASSSAEPIKRTIGQLTLPKAVGAFQPPKDWKAISESAPSLGVSTTIEIYKQTVRHKRKMGDDDVPSEAALMAETNFWAAKKAVPKQWLEMETPETVISSLSVFKPRRSGQYRGSKRPVHHQGADDSHQADACPRATIAEVPVKKISSSKETSVPVVINPAFKAPPLTLIMAEQEREISQGDLEGWD